VEVGDAKTLNSEISNNVSIMDVCEIVILAFKPHMARELLSQRLVKRALAGKMVSSILGAVTTQEIKGWIRDSDQDNCPPTCVVRAIPNMAAQIGKSMTIIERSDILHPAQQEDLVWIFQRLGHVKIIDPDAFDAASMLAGSSMALLSVGLDGLLDGSVKEGLKRADALELAAHAMLGMAEMFRTGVQPADFRESVSSPGGSTITGLITVESAGVRGAFARGMIDGTKMLRK
jgi:pyrroline-5-carboxylate reductase